MTRLMKSCDGIERIPEHDDVAAPGIRERDDLLLDDRQPDAVDELVHENEVAHFERGSHRGRRYLERLSQERAQQEDGQQNREKRFRIFDPDRFARPGAPIAGEERAVQQPDDAGYGGQHEQDQGKVHRESGGKEGVKRDNRRSGRAALSHAENGVGVVFPAATPARAEKFGKNNSDPISRAGGHLSPTCRIARNASCGISTLPTDFIRFLPAFCFSSSFFLRVMSPP